MSGACTPRLATSNRRSTRISWSMRPGAARRARPGSKRSAMRVHGREDRNRHRLHHARLSPPSGRSGRPACRGHCRQRSQLAQWRRALPDRGSLDRVDRRLFRRSRARRRADVCSLCRLAADLGDPRYRRARRTALRFRPLPLSRQSAPALRAADAFSARLCRDGRCDVQLQSRSTARA